MTNPIVIKPTDTIPSKPQHFEDLWEAAEALYAPTIADATVATVVQELSAKLMVYKAVSDRDVKPEEKAKVIQAIFGKILMACVQLSLKDNINAYAALQDGIEDKKLLQIEAQFANQPITNPRVDAMFDEMKEKLSSSGMAGLFDGLGEALKKAQQ